MEKIRAVKNRTLFAGALAVALTGLAVLSLSLMGLSCATVELRMPSERQYDPNYGETAEDITQNFNLRHGRYYNYFSRGAVYLAFGHYDKALVDFNEAIDKRERDSRNTPTYGMHFIDYFPHRESGVARYFLGESAKADRKERHYRIAIEELEISCSHEETARAQSYLNLARRALWKVTKEQDRIPPIIRMNVTIPIYTNRRTVRFDVTATDDQSSVGDIRVDRSEGDVRIERPGPSTAFARKEVTTPIEITLSPGEKRAEVVITASDLAGNMSETISVPVILDTQAPTAGISIVGDRQPSNDLVRISIEAQDDFGLQQIRVGKDPAAKVECDGALKYTDTLSGSPDGKELAIELLDNAGNSTFVTIPLDEAAGQARPVSTPRSRIPGRLPRTDALDTPSYSRPLSRAYFAGLNPGLPHRAIRLGRTVNTNISPLTVAQGSGPVWPEQELTFERHVKKPEGGAKETSETNFTVEGKVRDVLNISRIRVELNEQREEPPLGPKGHGMRTFNSSLDLTKVPFDKEQTVSVKAYTDADPDDARLSEELTVIKRKDPSRYADAIYGILVLPLSPSLENGFTAPKASWRPSQLVSVYEGLIAELKARKLPDREPESQLKDVNAFRVYEIGDVYTGASIEEWCKKSRSPLSVARYLRDRWNKRTSPNTTDPAQIDPNVIDLVVFGELKIHSITKENEPNEEKVTMELRAMDVASARILRFPLKVGETTEVLADKDYTQYSEEYLAQDMQKELPKKQTFQKEKKWAFEELALLVAKNIPRLRHPDVVYDKIPSGAEGTLLFELGRDDGVFLGMKAWLYTIDAPKNVLLEKINCHELIDFDLKQCRIKCDKDRSKLLQGAYNCVLITK